jgi:hypothetical protein
VRSLNMTPNYSIAEEPVYSSFQREPGAQVTGNQSTEYDPEGRKINFRLKEE